MTIPKAYATLMNEPALVAQAASDPSAFAAIDDFYFDRVYNYVRLRVSDAQLADDLTSEIFERVLTKLDTYRPEREPFTALRPTFGFLDRRIYALTCDPANRLG